jgi:hypothetical protein
VIVGVCLVILLGVVPGCGSLPCDVGGGATLMDLAWLSRLELADDVLGVEWVFVRPIRWTRGYQRG